MISNMTPHFQSLEHGSYHSLWVKVGNRILAGLDFSLKNDTFSLKTLEHIRHQFQVCKQLHSLYSPPVIQKLRQHIDNIQFDYMGQIPFI